ncbi:MAG: DUF2332 domain-containing protein [Balneola sp.]
MDYQKIERIQLKDWFKRFAETECKGVSPMYYKLSMKIAEDDELISIASYCKQGQPMPNLFFAAIHFLLLNNPEEELTEYYPSITSSFKQNLPFELFKNYCLNHKTEIIEIEKDKIVQTNSLNRTAYLMPILSHMFEDQEINIIDIGTSAGLTLNMDKYEYYYNNNYAFGKSAVKIRSEIKEGYLPKFDKPVRIRNKIGIDQNPINLKINTNENWLKALIWADKTERLEKMEQAIKIAKQEEIDFRKASSLEAFSEIIASQEEGIPLVIYHTHTLYQFNQKDRESFWALIDGIGRKRDLTYIATEDVRVFKSDYGLKGILVELTEYLNGEKNNRIIAETNGHANWIKWNNKNFA